MRLAKRIFSSACMYYHINCTNRIGKLSVLYFFLIVVSSCSTQTAEHYGFITKLGSDTISVESITHKGNTLTSDEVDRFPRVRIRHTVVNLNTDGSIQHLEMDITTPSEPANERERKAVADVNDNTVHLSKKDGTGTVTRAFSTGGAIVMAHVPQMYSLYELYFIAAMKYAANQKLAAGSNVQMRQFYIDREFDHFPLGRVTVKLIGNGKAEIKHDWLSGTGEATMDSGYHMLAYSGVRTTYKVNVSRLTSSPDIKSIADRFKAVESKKGDVHELSVRDSVKSQIGNAMLAIDYSRPLLRGRKLLGDLLPYDRVWRTGANAATQFTTSAPIKLAGMKIPAGTYTLWTVPHRNVADLIVNKQSGQWGTEYNGSLNLGTAKFITSTVSVPVEEFTISITPGDAKHGTLVMQWGNFKWAAPIEVQ